MLSQLEEKEHSLKSCHLLGEFKRGIGVSHTGHLFLGAESVVGVSERPWPAFSLFLLASISDG